MDGVGILGVVGALGWFLVWIMLVRSAELKKENARFRDQMKNEIAKLEADLKAAQESGRRFVAERDKAKKEVAALKDNEKNLQKVCNAKQVGGTHWKEMAIEAWDYIYSNGIGFFEGNAIKYLSRWKKKGGISDLEKAKHYIEKLIELELAEGPKIQ